MNRTRVICQGNSVACPPCFANYSTFPKIVTGQMVADAVAALGSINLIAGELDR